MVFEINGVDITPYIAFNGIKWSRNDVDGPNAGRAMDGNMVRDRVSTKIRWDITCIPLTAAQQAIILQLIEPISVVVRYTDPQTGQVTTGNYYSNNFPSTFLITNSRGEEMWNGLAFPLIQI